MFLIIKEPYLKVTSDGSFGLRVDHVSDVEFLAANDSGIPKIWQGASPKKTAMAWKMTGNEFFGKAEYRAAIRAYTQALSCWPSDIEAHTVMLNRSLAFVKMRSFERALSDINAAAALSTPTEKALFRKAQALYRLQRFRECCDVLKNLCLEYPDNKAAKSDLARAIHRLAEHTHGRYDFRKMYTEAAT
jgi:tetratricopeptide (TPR) repeat protein